MLQGLLFLFSYIPPGPSDGKLLPMAASCEACLRVSLERENKVAGWWWELKPGGPCALWGPLHRGAGQASPLHATGQVRGLCRAACGC